MTPADTRHLTAAQGWLDLGNWMEANSELESIAPSERGKADVLDVRWQVFAKAGSWDVAVEFAGVTMQLAPQKTAETSYKLAQYACKLGRIADARTWLEQALEAGGKEMKLRALKDPEFEAVWVSKE